jgi:hypothetical protein
MMYLDHIYSLYHTFLDPSLKTVFNRFHYSILNTSLSIMDRTGQGINKKIEHLSNTVNQLDLIGFYRTLYPKMTEYTLFQRAYGAYSRITIC